MCEYKRGTNRDSNCTPTPVEIERSGGPTAGEDFATMLFIFASTGLYFLLGYLLFGR